MRMPILDSRTFEFFSRGPEQTRRLGIRLGALLKPGDLVCLSGDLGAGKTTLVQGMAQGFGSLDAVSSPTFVIVNQYRRPDGLLLSHLDAYRLQNAYEGEDLDLYLMLERGALVVEWPERIEAALPADRLWVKLRYMTEEQRGMQFSTRGKRYETLLSTFRRQVLGG
jgi:tRNA threonylcarbamoyladenosine biosynthesis protein TsaE